MPSKSKSQQRFFGMVKAKKKGEMENPSSKIKKAAEGMSMSDVKDFAETKHKGLPEKVDESIIRLTESDLHRIIKEAVDNILNDEPKDHIYSENEMKWLYDNQDGLSPLEQKVLKAGMWVRAWKANYHGYVKEWPNIAVRNGDVFYFDNGNLKKIPS